MATLLLTAVGAAIAGPIGGAIGALAGQRVDQALFGPKGRQGARLVDLAVQSSTYGASIPRIYGRMRVSGTVIWATDLREERRKVSQGKGRPKATVYSYSASFAVLLSGRPATRIGRIWADGKLLRGAAGDFKVETGFRFYTGAADQAVDPLIASAEGSAAPAYRGRSYAVFEDMALEGFGNRIPMLSFEVLADDADVTLADLLEDVADPEVLPRPTQTRLQGYVMDGANVRAAFAPLDALDPIGLRDDGRIVETGGAVGVTVAVLREDSGASPQGDGLTGLVRTRASSRSLPSRAEISFADVSRDFQSGLQSVDLHQEGAALRLDIPAALNADAARGLTVERLFAARREGESAELRLPWRCLATWYAGQILFDRAMWQVRKLRLEGMCLVLDLCPAPSASNGPMAADSGRPITEQDRPAGTTVLQLADLPPLGDASSAVPLVAVAAAGQSAAWRSAALLMRTDDQTDWQDIGGTAAPAIMGRCTSVLAPGSPLLLDLKNALTVELLHDEMALRNIDDAGLFAGRNAALVGTEIIQFGRAERLVPGQWRLTRLLRGRRGTEADIAAHGMNEPFLLLDPDTLLMLPLPAGSRSVDILAKGVGDVQEVQASCAITARAVRPLAPVHPRWEKIPSGGIRVSWIRRSREGWCWLDRVDAPLGEELERYRVTVGNVSGPATWDTSDPTLELSEAQAAEWSAQGIAALECAIVQVGRLAVSNPLTFRIPL